jgi:hypothetical protein
MSKGFHFTIFSNGIIRKKEDVLFLRNINDTICDILINTNFKDSYKRGDYGVLKDTLKILHNKISLGFNIYKEDFEACFLIELINKYSLKRAIRLGIASPILGYDNEYIPFDKHRIIAKKIVKFVSKCDKEDIRCDFDCGFTLCSFTKSEFGELHYSGSPLRTYCSNALDVSPDLTVWRCFATSALWNRNLADFKNINEIHQFFNAKVKAFQRVGALEKCLRCKYLERNQCSGGCLVHTLKSFNIECKMKEAAFI